MADNVFNKIIMRSDNDESYSLQDTEARTQLESLLTQVSRMIPTYNSSAPSNNVYKINNIYYLGMITVAGTTFRINIDKTGISNLPETNKKIVIAIDVGEPVTLDLKNVIFGNSNVSQGATFTVTLDSSSYYEVTIRCRSDGKDIVYIDKYPYPNMTAPAAYHKCIVAGYFLNEHTATTKSS